MSGRVFPNGHSFCRDDCLWLFPWMLDCRVDAFQCWQVELSVMMLSVDPESKSVFRQNFPTELLILLQHAIVVGARSCGSDGVVRQVRLLFGGGDGETNWCSFGLVSSSIAKISSR